MLKQIEWLSTHASHKKNSHLIIEISFLGPKDTTEEELKLYMKSDGFTDGLGISIEESKLVLLDEDDRIPYKDGFIFKMRNNKDLSPRSYSQILREI